MRRWSVVLSVCVVSLVALTFSSCNMDRSGHNTIRGGGLSMERPSPGCAACDHAMKHDGWCDKCNKGWVDGKSTMCKDCIQAKKDHTACKSCSGK